MKRIKPLLALPSKRAIGGGIVLTVFVTFRQHSSTSQAMKKYSGKKPLKPKQTMAICLLAAGTNVSNAAKQLGISRDTIHRWMHEPIFAKRLEELTRLAVSQAETQIGQVFVRAVERVSEKLEGSDADAILRTLGMAEDKNANRKRSSESARLRKEIAELSERIERARKAE